MPNAFTLLFKFKNFWRVLINRILTQELQINEKEELQIDEKDTNFDDKLTLLMQLGNDLYLSDKDSKKILDGFERTLLNVMQGDQWNENWENQFSSKIDVVTLLKGLVLLEAINKTNHGSASMPAVVFRQVRKLKLDTPELIDWILSNKHPESKYTPFGRNLGHLGSYKQYQEFLEAEKIGRVKTNANIIREEKIQRRFKEQKEQEKIGKAERHELRIKHYAARTEELTIVPVHPSRIDKIKSFKIPKVVLRIYKFIMDKKFKD